MKISKYNNIIETDNEKKIAFNSITCALAEVDENFMSIYNNIENIIYDELNAVNKELVDNMIEGGYIVKDEVDEFKLIKFNHLKAKYNTNSLGITIAPTLECNFACPYCYETPKKGYMSEEIQSAIIKMVEARAAKINDLSITWYGGEPLLGKDIIIALSTKFIEICERYNVVYNASMITNGYMLNEETVDKLKELKITDYQITIDGPPEIHNSRRKLKAGKGETFYRLINNIKLLKSRDLKPHIRVNIDRTNEGCIDELLRILKENYLNDIIINIGHVRGDTDACSSIEGECLSDKEYSEFEFEYKDLLKKHGFTNASSLEYYPKAKYNYCGADCISSFVVDAEGYMYKCWNEIGDVGTSIGNILEVIDNNIEDSKANEEYTYVNNLRYMLWSPFEFEDCRKCWLLPICMGGCPYNGMQNKNLPKCEKWRYTIENSMLTKYKQFCEEAE